MKIKIKPETTGRHKITQTSASYNKIFQVKGYF